jgi:hypothetical protein
MVSDATVVDAAASAAEDVIFSRFDRAEVAEYDATVAFEDGVLEVDVYINAPEATGQEATVADDAALAARSAVDELLE